MDALAYDLLALRSGEMDFGEFVRIHRKTYQRWSQYFYDRWPQDEYLVDDLVQEALVETWRAVDLWDPQKSPLDGYVKMHVGNRLRYVLNKATSRGRRKVVKPLCDGITYPVGSTRLELEQAAGLLESKLQRETLVGVGLGMPVGEIAARFYHDESRRQSYGFRSLNSGDRLTRWAAKKAARNLERRVTWVC